MSEYDTSPWRQPSPTTPTPPGDQARDQAGDQAPASPEPAADAPAPSSPPAWQPAPEAGPATAPGVAGSPPPGTPGAPGVDEATGQLPVADRGPWTLPVDRPPVYPAGQAQVFGAPQPQSPGPPADTTSGSPYGATAYGSAAGYGAGYPYGAGSAYGPPERTSSYPAGGFPPPHPGHPGQPWGPGAAPPRRRAGAILASVLVVMLLMGVSAIGGGVVGAWLYSQTRAGGTASQPGTTVIDGPQLDRASLAGIASRVQPSVVSINTGSGEGSGVVLSDDGHILTNAHVVASAQRDEVSVRFSNGQTAPATVVGADARTDLAVVRVQGASELTPAAFGDSDQLLVGDTVLAIGSPLGFQGSVTQGIVSALDRTLRVNAEGNPFGGGRNPTSLSGLIQTDASINPGNSGGALVNMSGEVIGINTAIATSGLGSGNVGLGFAIPSNRAAQVAESLIAGDEVSHPFMGVSVVSSPDGGALVGEVMPDSPADRAGLQEGDVITSLGDRPVTDQNDLVSAVQSSRVGDTLEVVYQRDGVTRTATVTLAEAD